MSFPCIVTIGHHHQGPHVDALMTLAERHGAVVVRLPDPHPAPTLPVRRVAYAGQDVSDTQANAWRERAL